jgi:ectoine hydroxylase-related dioxygenase (phytanoyl-CoA dioxygenase family)
VHWGSLLFTISISYYATYRYWGIEGTVVTAWLAVDDADVENGCMQVIPGKFTQCMHK